MQEQEKQYELFRYTADETMYSTELFGCDKDGKFFDGRNTWVDMSSGLARPYASLAISPVHSLLPTVAYRCRYHCYHWPGECFQDIFLEETKYPLYSCLPCLNSWHIVEHRITHDTVADVMMAGADPGTIQWQYRGIWTEEDMLPLDALFHRFVSPLIGYTWIVEKYDGLYHTYQIKDLSFPYLPSIPKPQIRKKTNHPTGETPAILAYHLEQEIFYPTQTIL